MNTAYKQYKQDSVYTSTPEELTLMLYNGLVKFIMQGINSLRSKDYEKANSSVLRSQDIVFEFQSALDKKYEVSRSLRLLYDYMHRRLIEANTKKDPDILEEVLGFAKELRDTWAQAMKTAKKLNRKKQAVSGQ